MPKETPVNLESKDTSGEAVYRRKHLNLFKSLEETTKFNMREIEQLAVLHRIIVKSRGTFNNYAFRNVFHSGMDFTETRRQYLVNQVFSAMNRNAKKYMTLENWITGLSIMLRGTLREKAEFAYRVYDLMDMKKLSKDNFFPMLRNCLIKLPDEDEDPDSVVEEMIDFLHKALDRDKDGEVSLEDFRGCVLNNNAQLLESIGPVFPSEDAIRTFLATFTDI